VDETTSEGKEPEESEEERDSSDYFSVDEALLVLRVTGASNMMEIIGDEAEYGSCKGELADAQKRGGDAFEDHFGYDDCFLMFA